MARAKRTPSSVKPARSTHKPPPAAKKRVPLKPALQGRSDATAPPDRGETKRAHVIALLERDTGATLNELIAATGWLPHTTRAALTGLRHKGFVLDKGKRADGTTVYRTSAPPPDPRKAG
jgi:hypothetical protein